MNDRKLAKLLTILPSVIAIAAGLALVAGRLSSAESFRRVLDRLSPGGAAESVSDIASLQARAGIIGGVWIVVGLVLLVPRLRVGAILSDGLRALGRAPADVLRASRHLFSAEPWQAITLSVVTLASLGLALLVLFQPVRCDEGHTAIAYVSRSVPYILTGYDKTNNHVLHSLLAHFSWSLFGAHTWALRLPALAAATLAVPVAYVAVRRLFGKATALVAAAAIATWPYLFDLSTNARGYTMVNLVVLILIALAPHLVHANTRAIWLGVVIVVSAGFFTIPVMAVPFAIVGLWLLIEGVFALAPGKRGPYYLRLVYAALSIVALSALLYTPSILFQGKRVAFTAGYMRPGLPGSEVGARSPSSNSYLELMDTLFERVGEAWGHWVYELSAAHATIGLVFVALAFVLPARGRPSGVRFLWLAALTPIGVILAGGRIPPLWSLPFLLVLYSIAFAVGSVELVRRLVRRVELPQSMTLALTLAILMANGVATIVHRDRQYELPSYIGYHDAEAAAEFIRDELGPHDRVAALLKERYTIDYYFRRIGNRDQLRFWLTIDHAATWMESDSNLYLIEPAILRDWEPKWRAKLQAAVESVGFVRTSDVTVLPHSQIVRYELPSGDDSGR